MTDYRYEARSYDHRPDRDRSWQPTDFQRGAIEAAFFTADPFPYSGEYCLDWDATWNTLPPEDRKRFIAACEAFETKFGKLLELAVKRSPGRDIEAAGRDYHYTSQGHGVGFWEPGRWEAKAGALLDQACKAHRLPEVHADLDCDHFREVGGEGCGECDGCATGPTYYVE